MPSDNPMASLLTGDETALLREAEELEALALLSIQKRFQASGLPENQARDQAADLLSGTKAAGLGRSPPRPQLKAAEHTPGCWVIPGHHACAIAEIHNLQQRMLKIRTLSGIC